MLNRLYQLGTGPCLCFTAYAQSWGIGAMGLILQLRKLMLRDIGVPPPNPGHSQDTLDSEVSCCTHLGLRPLGTRVPRSRG